jgi:methyl-accepting chemotaxis protein
VYLSLLQTVQHLDAFNQQIEGLLQHARGISEGVTYIDAVTLETTILALNASIEAKRAGEAGKGFSVVASDVQKLSQDTSKYAQNIGHLAQSINESLDKVYGKLKNIREKIQGDLKGVSEAQSNMTEIESIANLHADNNRFLNTSVEHFSRAYQEVGQAIDTLANQISTMHQLLSKYKFN